MIRDRIKNRFKDRIISRDASLWPWLAAGIILSLALGIGAYSFFREVVPPPEPPPVQPEPFRNITAVAGPKMTVKLFFPSRDGDHLKAEEREIARLPELTDNIWLVVEELIRGPKDGLTPSFPAGARLKSVYLDEAGTAFVNFSRELQTEYPGGAWTETLTIYSLTNTLAANFPDDIKAVQILVEGSEIPTLAGHIDTSHPFAPMAALNRG